MTIDWDRVNKGLERERHRMIWRPYGLPEVVNGRTCYPLDPETYAREMKRFVTDYEVSVVGGCCGTTAAHIRRLVEELDGVQPARREVVR